MNTKGETIKVIGVGFGGTGTTSIQRSLGGLGRHAYNFVAVMQNEPFGVWREAGEGRPNWREIFYGYDATISWPACFFTMSFTKLIQMPSSS